MASGTFDLTGNQSLLLTGTHDSTLVNVSGSSNNVEIDNTWSRDQGTISGDNNYVAINNPDIPGTRIFGDSVAWDIHGTNNTIDLTGDFKDVGMMVAGSGNTVNFNGDFKLDLMTVTGTNDVLNLDHLRTHASINTFGGGFQGSLISFAGPGDVLALSNGSNAAVNLDNTVTQADTIDIIGNQFGRANSVVNVFGLTPTDGVIDFHHMGFNDPTAIYNALISNPTTLANGVAGFSLHLTGPHGDLFIAGNSFTADNFKTS